MNLQKSALPVSSSSDLCPFKAWSLPAIVPFVDRHHLPPPPFSFSFFAAFLSFKLLNVTEMEVNVIKICRKKKTR